LTTLTWAARQAGKMQASRVATEKAALAGEHVHAVRADGVWCITWQPPLGYLRARLRALSCNHYPRGHIDGAGPSLQPRGTRLLHARTRAHGRR
jgi:hypothetical protein